MKIVTEKAIRALLDGKEKTLSPNTRVYNAWNGWCIDLHGARIAIKKADGLYVSLCGYNTNTTRERINGVFELLGVNARIITKSYSPFLSYKQTKIPYDWFITQTNWNGIKVDKDWLDEKLSLYLLEKEKENKTKKGNKNSCKR